MATDITFPSQLYVSSEMEIVSSANATLSGGASTRLLYVTSTGHLRLTSLTLTGGYVNGDGGAIYVESSGALTMDSCVLYGNTAVMKNLIVFLGVPLQSEGNGGAVFFEVIGIEEVTDAAVEGSSTEATLTACVFRDNVASKGGAIYFGPDITLLAQLTLIGGSHLYFSTLTCISCKFQSNVALGEAWGQGGAVCLQSLESAEFRQCSFVTNTAATTSADDSTPLKGSTGGAVEMRQIGSAVVSECVFLGNCVEGTHQNHEFSIGGGIFSENIDLTLSECLFFCRMLWRRRGRRVAVPLVRQCLNTSSHHAPSPQTRRRMAQRFMLRVTV